VMGWIFLGLIAVLPLSYKKKTSPAVQERS